MGTHNICLHEEIRKIPIPSVLSVNAGSHTLRLYKSLTGTEIF